MKNSHLINIDVIILSNAFTSFLRNMTQQTVNSLIESENSLYINFNVIVIESYSAISPFQYNHTTTIYPNESFGYNKFVNIGIGMTNNDYICVCNNDLLFFRNWASNIVNEFNSDKLLMSACPICPIHHAKANIKINNGLYYGYVVRKEIVGWCIFLKKLLDIIGLFDPKFKFWYADDDYAKTLQVYNIKHALVTNSIVKHFESKTLDSLALDKQLQLTIKEKCYFDYKWNSRNYVKYRNTIIKNFSKYTYRFFYDLY